MRTGGNDDRAEIPVGLVAYELTDQHTLFVMEVPGLPAGLPLSKAERGVVELILDGCSNAAIAARRGVSSPTVAKQVSAVFAKLGVRSRAELVARLVAAAAGPR